MLSGELAVRVDPSEYLAHRQRTGVCRDSRGGRESRGVRAGLDRRRLQSSLDNVEAVTGQRSSRARSAHHVRVRYNCTQTTCHTSRQENLRHLRRVDLAVCNNLRYRGRRCSVYRSSRCSCGLEQLLTPQEATADKICSHRSALSSSRAEHAQAQKNIPLLIPSLQAVINPPM